MAVYRVEVWAKPTFEDPRAGSLLRDARAMGLKNLEKVAVGDVYLLRGKTGSSLRRKIARLLLADPITQDYFECRRRKRPGTVSVEVYCRPGVTDNTGETTREAIDFIAGTSGITSVSTGKRYFFSGPGLLPDDVKALCGKLLANDLVQDWKVS